MYSVDNDRHIGKGELLKSFNVDVAILFFFDIIFLLVTFAPKLPCVRLRCLKLSCLKLRCLKLSCLKLLS